MLRLGNGKEFELSLLESRTSVLSSLSRQDPFLNEYLSSHPNLMAFVERTQASMLESFGEEDTPELPMYSYFKSMTQTQI